MKKTLGLDLGTNSIGWALVEEQFDEKISKIDGMGSRIIPMSKETLDNFGVGVQKSATSERTQYRGVRRLVQRDLLRRERLHRVLNVLGFLPNHYSNEIDFEKHFGQFKNGTEPKLVYKIGENGKNEFLFMESYNEMLSEFKTTNPTLLEEGKKIPFDWTIYYLRKKALTKKIEKEELAWLLLNFNQKRGYYQLRGEDEVVKENKLEEYYSFLITDVVDSGDRKATDVWYNIILENGWVYKRSSRIPLFDWVGKTKDFIVTTDLNDDGTVKTDKDGKEKRSFRAPKEDDWTLVKKKTETDIINSDKTVGCFIYDTLLQKPTQKINGKLVRTIEREFYKKELASILKVQLGYISELTDSKLYTACIEELYPNNEAHKNNIKNRDFVYLLLDDIIFYQRPLKSKKSLISNCSFENKIFIVDGIEKIEPLKCIAKSHPYYQEFRLLQFVRNLKIYEREQNINGKLFYDADVTKQYLQTENEYEELFNWLNNKADVTQKQFLAYPKFKLKEDKYRWNFVEDKSYPCNETRSVFVTKASKIKDFDILFFNEEKSIELWHILYSVTDKIEIGKAIKSFAKKYKLPNDFAEAFSKLKPYDSDYGAYSTKAIKKLLSLMRFGNNWNENNIDKNTKNRIDKILTGEYDLNIKNRVREKAIDLKSITDFKGLPLWLASYIIYDRHSEASDIAKWETPDDIAKFLKFEFKQHSLRNPIVEQIITETLRVVKDIWVEYGYGKENFFDEIHIELGRDMKNPADKRKRMTEKISENENTNLRIKALLTELKNDGIRDIRPFSPSQQEILKIYEEGVYQYESRKDKLDEVDKIRKTSKPTKAEINKYKLWLEQGYASPYTGKTIPLSLLFTTKYQIEHIFPQSRFFDDSMTNKVICEAEVNQLKDNKTAYEFIIDNKGSIVELNGGGSVKLFNKEEYENHIQKYFAKNKTKLKNLLSEDVPDSFINRQLNDSRYISKVVKSLLSRIVREEKDGELEQEATSKNVITLNGAITSQMKQDWGLNDIWNEIITPRFERLNAITNTNDFGSWENKQGKKVFQITVPEEVSKGFSKKRIDHRHHALDALVIACVGRNHINYLNNLNAKDENDRTVKHELRNTLCFKTKPDEKGNYKWEFKKPWETFTEDVKEKLLGTIVSFKQNIRVINKTNNRYQKWMPDANGIMKKEMIKQEKGDNWAIRKPLHKETVYAKVNLKREKETPVTIANAIEKIESIADKNIKTILKDKLTAFQGNIIETKKYFKTNPIKIEDTIIDRVKIYETITATAGRVLLDNSFDKNKIEAITDTGIQKILFAHLQQEKYQNQKDENGKIILPQDLAFSEEGIDEMNKNLVNHQPIIKVRTFEQGSRFAMGHNGNKKDKYVEAAKGTNLFFAIYQNSKGIRNYKTIPLNEVIESQKMGIANAPETDENGNQLLFTLSPNDLVYVPTENEMSNSIEINFNKLTNQQVKRIYKMVSFSNGQAFFVINNLATSIVDKKEFSALNKMEKDLDGNMIKAICIKLKTNRLGKISKA
jgi:CRISPR-associated endonuclease Csn1